LGIWKWWWVSFIVCQETGGTASASYRAVAGERVERHFPVSKVSAGNMLPASNRLGEPEWLKGNEKLNRQL